MEPREEEKEMEKEDIYIPRSEVMVIRLNCFCYIINIPNIQTFTMKHLHLIKIP